MYDRILVPTNGSRSAEAAAHHGVVLAEAFDASVHVVSVTGEKERDERLAKAEAQDAISHLKELFEQESDRPCQLVIEHGSPYEAILSYATENDIELIVMGTHGRRGLSRVLLGSVTERVIRLSTDPVVAVPPRATAREREKYRRILIPTDGSLAGTAAVEHGIRPPPPRYAEEPHHGIYRPVYRTLDHRTRDSDAESGRRVLLYQRFARTTVRERCRLGTGLDFLPLSGSTSSVWEVITDSRHRSLLLSIILRDRRDERDTPLHRVFDCHTQVLNL